MADRPWAPFAWFVLRGTGMPFDWLASQGGAPLWDGPADAAGWDARLQASRAALWHFTQRPSVREAIFMSNPELDAHLDGWEPSLTGARRAFKDRARERALTSYAGRLCAKNDTTSFFGAVSLGRLDRVDDLRAPRPVGAVRQVFVEQWAAQALLDAARADLEAEGAWIDHPRRAPLVARDDAGAFARHALAPGASWFSAVELLDEPGAAAILAAADGERGAPDLAAAAGVPDGDAVVARLLASGALLSATRLPEGTQDVVGHALGVLARQPESAARALWIERLHTLTALVTGFATADLATRREELARADSLFEAWTGAASRRHPGKHYAARTPLHERGDRSGEVVGLPAGWGARLQASLASYLELSQLPVLADRMAFRAWYERHYGDDEARPWGEVVRDIDRVGVRYQLATPKRAIELRAALRAYRDALREQVDTHLAEHGAAVPLRLDPERFRALVGDRFAAEAAEDGRAYAAPDMMFIAGPDGAGTPIVGEAHAMPFHEPSLYAASPRRAEVWRAASDFLAELCAPARPGLVCRGRVNFLAWTTDLGQVDLELDGPSQVPHARRASLLELALRQADDGLFDFSVTTHAGDTVAVMPLAHGSRVRLASRVYAVDLLDLAEWLGGGDWRPAWELPRLSWGDLVVHRRRWRVPSEAWAGEGVAPWEAVRRLRDHCGDGLPRFCYTKPPDERKPMIFDWGNPVAVEMALWLAKRHEVLVFTEMLPGPDDLWLGGPDGRHTSELRTVFARQPG